MSRLGSERETRPWHMYTSSDSDSYSSTPPPLSTPTSRNFSTSMNAVSFGFVATAILISMFVLMAIFEHLFVRPSSPGLPVSASMHKPIITSEPGSALYVPGFSVTMPGRHGPTHIAKPAPLPPCSREDMLHWPQHEMKPSLS